MSLPKLELISFKLCPFVQRSVITLLIKEVDFKITFIDLANKPDWFLKISPLGKVPVLKVEDAVLFESAVINEYLDEITPPSLHPADPLQKGLNRAWIEFGSGLLMNQYQLSMAGDQTSFESAKSSLQTNLGRLEQAISNGPYFNGEALSLVDTAFAPFLWRMELLNNRYKLNLLNKHPRITVWSSNLINLKPVQNSVDKDFEDQYINYINAKNSYICP